MNNSNKGPKKSINRFYLVKIIQLIIVSVIDIIYFSILMFSPALRSAVFGNKYLFTVSVIAWAALILSLVFILIDLRFMKDFRD